MVKYNPTNSRPSILYSTTLLLFIHAYIRVRKKVRFALHGISDEIACIISDIFDKY